MNITKGSIGPYLDIKVETERWLKTFKKYQETVRYLPVESLERQAVNLRIKLLKEFLTIKLGKGQAKREMKARGGRIRIRGKILAMFKGKRLFDRGAPNEAEKVTFTTIAKGGKNKGQKKKKTSSAWRRAVSLELAARQRSRSLLGASWLNRHHEQYHKTPRTAMFESNLKSRKLGNKVHIQTQQKTPRIVLENFVAAVGKVGQERGIIARSMRAASEDMEGYLQRRLERATAEANASK